MLQQNQICWVLSAAWAAYPDYDDDNWIEMSHLLQKYKSGSI